MNDSTGRPVSVELPRATWQELVSGATSADRVDEILAQIEDLLPKPLPTGLGAVIHARRPGEASVHLYVAASLTDNEDFHLRWREADSDGRWVHGRDLELVTVLSSGVEF